MISEKGDNIPITALNNKKVDYEDVNRYLIEYNRDYTTSTLLPSYLKHELNK